MNALLEVRFALLKAAHAGEVARAKADPTAGVEDLAALAASRDAKMGDLEGGSGRPTRSDRHTGPTRRRRRTLGRRCSARRRPP